MNTSVFEDKTVEQIHAIKERMKEAGTLYDIASIINNYVQTADELVIQLNEKLFTTKVELVGETPKAWIVVASVAGHGVMKSFIAKSQSRRVGDLLIVKSWLVRKEWRLTTAAKEYISKALM
jgi:hypothetical protein